VVKVRDVFPPAEGPGASPLAQAALRLAERWSEAARAQAIYPAGHHRVHASLEVLAQALAALHASAPAEPVQVVFTGRGVLANDVELAIPEGSGLTWLRERLEHAALAGVEIGPTATAAAFAALDERLLALYGRREPVADAAAAWADGEWPGLQPLDRRFEGVFDGEPAPPQAAPATQRTWAGEGGPRNVDPRHERLVTGLLQDRAMLKRLHRLTVGDATEGARTPAGDAHTLSPREVLDALASLVSSEDRGGARAPEVISHLVEALELRTQGRLSPADLAAQIHDAELGRRAAWLSSVLVRNDLGHEDATRVRAAPAQGPRGHAGDEKVQDDTQGFLDELARLPVLGGQDPLERPAEELGVLLHLVMHHADPVRAPRLLALLAAQLREVDRESRDVLARMLHAAAQRADGTDLPIELKRALDALRSAGHFALVRQCGFLSYERVLESFPTHFGDWLQSLQPASGPDRDELVRMLGALGRERLQAQADRLGTPEQLCRPGLAAAVLCLPLAALAPLASVWLRSGDADARVAVIAWLRRLRLRERPAQVLELIQDPAGVPQDVLAGLIASVQGRPLPAAAVESALKVTADFVRASAGRPDRRARRLEALRMLGGYALPEATALLQEVVKRRRWLVVPIEDRLTRQVASEMLRRMGAA
jgi:hypothetical protein